MLVSTLSLVVAATVLAAPADAPVRVSLEGSPRAASFLDTGSGGGGGASINPLLFVGEVAIGTVAGYLGFTAGVLLNLPLGGFSSPIDAHDVLYLFALPLAAAGSASWLVGLFDLGQRSFLGSMLHSLIGAVIGEGVAIGVGFLLAFLFPAVGLPALFWAAAAAPGCVALGSTLAMELLKSGGGQASPSALWREERGVPSVSPMAALAF